MAAKIYRYFAFAEETTFGTGVYTGGGMIDPESAEMDPAGDQVQIYEGISGLDKRAVYAAYRSEGSVSCLVDLKAFPWFLKWALGGYSKTGTVPNVTHSFFPDQSPLMKSFTARVGKDYFEHAFTGCVVSSLGLELDGGFLVASIDIIGGKDEKRTLEANPAMTEGEVYAAHDVTLSMDAADISPKVESFSIKIENGADNEAGITIGSRFPRRAFRGAMTVEVELGMSFLDSTDLEKFWGSTSGPVSSGTPTESNITINVGPNIDIIIPRAVWMAIGQPVSGRERIEQTVTLRGLVSNTGTGPIEFSITNDVATY